MAKREVEIQASLVQDSDNCLDAAERILAERESVDDWRCTARWTTEERDAITVSILDT